MTKSVSALALALLLCSLLPRAGVCSGHLIFTPGPYEGDGVPPEKGKGILVERLTIQPGDTLGKISRKFSGKASYFPQILLFNDIMNPDRIFAGEEILVPVGRQSTAATGKAPQKKSAQPAADRPVSRTKPAVPGKAKPAGSGKGNAGRSASEKPSSMVTPAGQSEYRETQSSYQTGLNKFRAGDFSGALTAFSKFLDKHPDSPLAPEASLYKAECLLKLSGE